MAAEIPLQGFLSGGELNTQQSTKGTVKEFSPTSAVAQPKLQVVAPLDVNAAPTQAMALAKALNVGIATAEPMLEQKAVQYGADQSTKGQADVALGQVDPDKMAKIDAYRMGATRAITEKSTLDAISKVEAFVASPEGQALPLTDTAGDGTTPMKKGLLSTVDDMFRSALGGLTKDPDSARVVAPMVQHTMNEIAGERTQRDIKNNQQNAEDSATAIALRSAKTGDGSFNWKDQQAKLRGVYGGDNRAANSALIHSVAAAAIAAKDPSLLDKFIPESITTEDGQTLAGPGQTPENAAYLATARAQASAAQKGQWEEDRKVDTATITTLTLNGKDPTAAIKDYLSKPGASFAEAQSMYNFYQAKQEKGVADTLDGPSTYKLQTQIATGDITTPAQIVAYANGTGIKGKALGQLVTKGMDMLHSTQSTTQDDPSIRAGLQDVDGTYKAVTGPAGNILAPAASAQHVAAMVDYKERTTQLMRQGKTAEEAATTATREVKEKYGAPMTDSQGQMRADQNVPKTDHEQGNLVRTAPTNAAAMRAAGITGATLKHLVDSGEITFAEASAAAQAILDAHHS